MPGAFIEHVNVTVRDPERSAKLMHDLFGWNIRWQGPAISGGRSIHVGDDRFYMAFYTKDGADTVDDAFRKGRPLNHVGIVVDDLDDAERRVVAAGLEPFNHGDYDPGRRFYFFDFDGTEFELVSYS